MSAKWEYKKLAYLDLTEVEKKSYQRYIALAKKERCLGPIDFLAICRATQAEYDSQRQFKEFGACNFHPYGCPEGSHAT